MKATFYIVWNPDGPTAPRFRHDTLGAAQREARRLAAAQPGQDFFVMQAHYRVTLAALDAEYFATDEVPF